MKPDTIRDVLGSRRSWLAGILAAVAELARAIAGRGRR